MYGFMYGFRGLQGSFISYRAPAGAKSLYGSLNPGCVETRLEKCLSWRSGTWTEGPAPARAGPSGGQQADTASLADSLYYGIVWLARSPTTVRGSNFVQCQSCRTGALGFDSHRIGRLRRASRARLRQSPSNSPTNAPMASSYCGEESKSLCPHPSRTTSLDFGRWPRARG